jgi:hypothetical protein
MPIFSIAFVLLLSLSVVMPPNLVVVVGGVTKLLFIICRVCIYIESSMLLVHMDVPHEPFLP